MAWIQGLASFQGSRLEGVHCIYQGSILRMVSGRGMKGSVTRNTGTRKVKGTLLNTKKPRYFPGTIMYRVCTLLWSLVYNPCCLFLQISLLNTKRSSTISLVYYVWKSPTSSPGKKTLHHSIHRPGISYQLPLWGVQWLTFSRNRLLATSVFKVGTDFMWQSGDIRTHILIFVPDQSRVDTYICT